MLGIEPNHSNSRLLLIWNPCCFLLFSWNSSMIWHIWPKAGSRERPCSLPELHQQGHGDCFNLCTATYELHMFTHCYMENRTWLTCVSRGSDPAGCTISSCLLTWHMWGLWSMFAEGSWNFTVAFGGNKIWVLESDIDASGNKNHFVEAKVDVSGLNMRCNPHL